MGKKEIIVPDRCTAISFMSCESKLQNAVNTGILNPFYYSFCEILVLDVVSKFEFYNFLGHKRIFCWKHTRWKRKNYENTCDEGKF